MSATLATDAVVGRHREGLPGLIHVSAFGIRRRSAVFAWFRRSRHRMPEPTGTTTATPAFRPAT